MTPGRNLVSLRSAPFLLAPPVLLVPILVAALAWLPGTAQSQDQSQSDAQPTAENRAESSGIVDVDQWDPEALYAAGAFLADQIVGASVYDPDDNEIGSVENLVIDREGRITGVIAEVGGFWNLGDTHIAIPWDDVSFYQDGIQTPVREENLDDYDLYGELSFVTKEELQRPLQVAEDLNTGPRTWKITSLLNDYASLQEGVGYGHVDNVVFSEDGTIEAVVVQVRGATRSFPFYGYEHGWHPGYNTYVIPYEADEIDLLPPFDYDRFRDQAAQ